MTGTHQTRLDGLRCSALSRTSSRANGTNDRICSRRTTNTCRLAAITSSVTTPTLRSRAPRCRANTASRPTAAATSTSWSAVSHPSPGALTAAIMSSARTGTLCQVPESAVANGTPAGIALSAHTWRPSATTQNRSAPTIDCQATNSSTSVSEPSVQIGRCGRPVVSLTRRLFHEPDRVALDAGRPRRRVGRCGPAAVVELQTDPASGHLGVVAAVVIG